MAGWYKDRTLENIDPKVALAAAGGAARGLSHLAKVPLDIANRELEEKKVALDKYIAELNSNTKLSVAEKNAAAKAYQAKLGLRGRVVTAAAKDRATDASIENSKRSSSTQKTVAKINLDSAKTKAKGRGPTKQVTIDEEGGEKTVYKDLPLDHKMPKKLKKDATNKDIEKFLIGD